MKSMAFIDFQNFDISMRNYLSYKKEKSFHINYLKLTNQINDRIHLSSTLMKTYLFAYKPCEELMKLPHHQGYYNWLSGMKNKPFIEVIEGSQEIRPASKDIKIDINDNTTYTTEEKGTDINLAVNMVSKGYQNAYDIAILISGDTDYIPVVRELHHIGKIVVLATLPNQNISKYDEYMDAHINIDLGVLRTCEIKNSKKIIFCE